MTVDKTPSSMFAFTLNKIAIDFISGNDSMNFICSNVACAINM